MNDRIVDLGLHIDRSIIDGTARKNEPHIEFSMTEIAPGCGGSEGNGSDWNAL